MMFDHDEDEMAELNMLEHASASSSSSCGGDPELRRILQQREAEKPGERPSRLIPSIIQYKREQKKVKARADKKRKDEKAKKEKLALLEQGFGRNARRNYDKQNGFIVGTHADRVFEEIRER